MSKADYTWKGDTWWTVDRSCPECRGIVGSNGKIQDCYNCKWWEKI